jgi:hypothetical protein
MLFKFTGEYTNGHETIDACGVLFHGNEPSEVSDPAAIKRLSGHPEFEAVDPLDHDGDGEKGGSPKGKRATRSRKKAPAK